MKLGLSVLLMALVAALPAGAQRRPQTPVVETTHSVPSAVAPGQTTELTFHNAPAGEAVALWTSFPAKVAFSGSEGGKVRCRVEVGPDVPVGIGAVRLYTTGAVASLQLLMVDDLPSAREAGDNTSPKSAQGVATLVAVDASCEAVSSDYYRVTVSKGQRVSFEAVAQRLGSRMDPVIRLLDSGGRELAYCDDAPGAGADARISHRFEADGQYLVEVRDANHEGGPDYRYRLRIGDFPMVIAPFPLGVRKGGGAELAVDTADGGAVGPVGVAAAAGSVRQWVAVKYPGGRSSGFTSLVCGDAEEAPPSHDNTAAGKAVALSVPGATSGRFEAPGVRRFYGLALKQGQRLGVRARTRSLGSPCDALLRVLKPDGSQVAQSDSRAAEEASLEFTAAANGDYLLTVEELAGLAGPGMVFRLEVERLTPDFGLSVETEKVNVAAGGSIRVKVAATRRGYDGPIALSLAGDAALEGLELKNTVIGKDKKETELEVRVPAGLEPRPIQFKVVGRAKVGEADVVRTASTLPALKLLFPRLAYPPAELDGLIGLGVRAASK